MKRARTCLASFAIVLAIAVSGACKKSDPVLDLAAPQAVESPVPTPTGHVADLYMGAPNATWSKVQRGVGGAAGILPSTLGGLVCALSGLDPGVGPDIDGAAPVYGVMAISSGGDALEWALAMKLVDPRKARAVLLESETARFSSREVAGMTELLPKGNPPQVAAALARGGYLVVARNAGDLERLGPYAYRTLPPRPAAASALVIDLPGAALKGPVAGRLAAEWSSFQADMLRQDEKMRASHGGRAPDFGDPKAILATVDTFVKGKLALLGDLDRGRISVDADEDDIHAVLSLVPAAGGGPAQKAVDAMHPGDGQPLLAAPISSLAILVRDDAQSRARDVADAEAAIVGALGARLPGADAKKLHAVLEDWTKARGDWMALGLLRADTLWLKAPTKDPASSARAIRGAVELVKADPLKQALHLREITFTTPSIVGIGQGELATVTVGEGAAATNARKLDLFWTTTGTTLQAFASQKLVVTSDPTAGTLGADPVVAAAVKALEGNATFAVVAQPSRLDPASGPSAAPLVAAWGRKGPEAWARVEIADVLLRDLIKSKMGL